ncbi:MAG: non-canonical purine NTP pyrophosphatase [Candidatus Kerfeldbacteria bacterium]|nr:non-canonical purine NTP pyrophosphatase [Candidatus Kerfeldbacteria bacterium]
MSTLLIATANPAKLSEFKEILEPLVDQLVTLGDLKITEKPIEDGETFAENSLLKANFYWQKTNLPTLADDGGLEVDALGGRPGVHSRVIDGKRLSDQELRDWILQKLRGIPEKRRTAKLKTVVTLRVSNDKNFQKEMSIDGLVRASDLPIDPGYPYRSVFFLPVFNKFFVELTPEEHDRVNHRKKALIELIPYITQYL